jgi:hypothetical protein
MSYDLYFLKPKIKREDFNSYFENRANYQIEEDQAVYQNEDTGVYFIFDYNEKEKIDENEIAYSIALSINYYRPVIFGLEAELEVSSLIKYFNFEILDVQTNGMGNGPYTKEGFLKAWNVGNEFGYSAILQSKDPPNQVFARNSTEIISIWNWNFHKNELQENIHKDIFIPRILYLTINGKLQSTIVWPDGISTLIPKVDCLYIPRKELAQRKLFKKMEDKCIISLNDAYKIIEQYENTQYSIIAYELPCPNTTKEIKHFVSSLIPNEPVIQNIAMDSILDFDLAKKYLVDTEIIG